MFSWFRADTVSWRMRILLLAGLVAQQQVFIYGLPVQAQNENKSMSVSATSQNDDLTNVVTMDDVIQLLEELKNSPLRNIWYNYMHTKNPYKLQQDLPIVDSDFKIAQSLPVTERQTLEKRIAPEATYGRYSNYYRQHSLYNTKNNLLSAMFNSNSNQPAKIFGRSQPEGSLPLKKRWGSENIFTNRQSQLQQHNLWKLKQRILGKIYTS